MQYHISHVRATNGFIYLAIVEVKQSVAVFLVAAPPIAQIEKLKTTNVNAYISKIPSNIAKKFLRSCEVVLQMDQFRGISHTGGKIMFLNK